MPITRTETIPLREGEALSTTEQRDGEIVVTITTRETHRPDREAGRRFLEFTKRMKEEHPIDLKALDADPDPRLRAILDGFPE